MGRFSRKYSPKNKGKVLPPLATPERLAALERKALREKARKGNNK